MNRRDTDRAYILSQFPFSLLLQMSDIKEIVGPMVKNTIRETNGRIYSPFLLIEGPRATGELMRTSLLADRLLPIQREEKRAGRCGRV